MRLKIQRSKKYVSINRTVIIGSGHAGCQCAFSLRAAGYPHEICIIDEDDAEVPYHKPPLSKKFIKNKSQSPTALRAESAFSKADLKRIRGTVMSVDPAKKTLRYENENELAFDFLVFATGAVSRSIPDLKGIDNVHSLRTLSDAQRFRESLLDLSSADILGGGFIGLEVAACLIGMGISVKVLEIQDRVLARVVSPAISAYVESYLKDIGVKLYVGHRISGFVAQNNVLETIKFEQGNSIDTELLLTGIGAIAQTTLAMEAGIDCDDGILVDSTLRTSFPTIFAIGDCSRFKQVTGDSSQRLESVQNAVDQAKAVALDIANKTETAYDEVPWFWSDIGTLKLQIAGIRSNGATEISRIEDDKLAIYHLLDNKVVCVESINSARDHLLARKLIAAQTSVTADDIRAGPDTLKTLLNS